MILTVVCKDKNVDIDMPDEAIKLIDQGWKLYYWDKEREWALGI